MSVGSISLPQPMPRHQLPASVTQQRVAGQLAQLKANGMPKSPLSPSGTAGTGSALAGVASHRLLNMKV